MKKLCVFMIGMMLACSMSVLADLTIELDPQEGAVVKGFEATAIQRVALFLTSQGEKYTNFQVRLQLPAGVTMADGVTSGTTASVIWNPEAVWWDEARNVPDPNEAVVKTSISNGTLMISVARNVRATQDHCLILDSGVRKKLCDIEFNVDINAVEETVSQLAVTTIVSACEVEGRDADYNADGFALRFNLIRNRDYFFTTNAGAKVGLDGDNAPVTIAATDAAFFTAQVWNNDANAMVATDAVAFTAAAAGDGAAGTIAIVDGKIVYTPAADYNGNFTIDYTATFTDIADANINGSIDVTVANYDYIIENDHVTITGYKGAKTSLDIPATIEGKPVTSIGNRAFRGCSSLASVVIPVGVTSIGESVFENCSSLSSVVIPAGVTSIGYGAFSSCSNLSSVEIPSGVTSIGEWAFFGCSGLSSVVIPSDVTSIGEWAFSNCSGLSSVVIPSSVTEFGDYAFAYCLSLSSIVIPAGVTSWGTCAFEGCSSLSSVVIATGVTTIGQFAFSECSSLSSVEIPSGVTSIGYGAFSGCSSLSSIVIPESVTSIEGVAFSGCSSLSSIVIPDGVTSISYYAFSGCSSLTSVVIPEGVTEIGRLAFSRCASLMVITIPDSVTDIEDKSAFEDSGLQVVRTDNEYARTWFAENFPDVLVIGKDEMMPPRIVRRDGETVSSTVLIAIEALWEAPEGVVARYTLDGSEPTAASALYTGPFEVSESCTVGAMFFNEDGPCSPVAYKSFYAVTVVNGAGGGVYSEGDEVTVTADALAEDYVFDSWTATGVTLSQSQLKASPLTFTMPATDVTMTANYACDYNYTVADDGVTITGYKGAKTSLDIPATIEGKPVVAISSSAFYGRSKLSSIVIPEGVTSIGTYAFYGCASLVVIAIPNSVTSIKNKNAFTNSGLQIVRTDNEYARAWFAENFPEVMVIKMNEMVALRIARQDGKDGWSVSSTALIAIETIGEAPEGGVVRYTLDGSEPTAASALYTGPFMVSESCTVGAMFFNEDGPCSPVAYKTFLHISETGLDQFCTESGLSFETTDSFPWGAEAVVEDNVETVVARSGKVSHSQDTSLRTTVSGQGVLSFSWKVSSQENRDKLTFAIDGVVQDSISGTAVGWKQQEYVITDEGEHRLTWTYAKDGSGNRGNDCGWLADVAWGDLPKPVGIAIDGLDSIGKDATKTYACTVTWDGGIVTTETPRWSLSSTAYAFVDETGAVRNRNTTAEDQTVTLNASYTINGVTQTASKTITLKHLFTYAVTVVNGTGGGEYSEGDEVTVTADAPVEDSVFDSWTATGVTLSQYELKASSLTFTMPAADVTMTANYAYDYDYTVYGGEVTITGYKGVKTTSLEIPATIEGKPVVAIGNRAFQFSSLTSITLPPSVIWIDYYAFYSCSNLSSIVIPDGVTSIADFAFSGCSGLSSVVIPESVTVIGSSAFSGCSSLSSIVIPDCVTKIYDSAFSGCSGLSSVGIPDGVTSIGNYAFSGCSGLSSVVIPDGVTSIGKGAFGYCSSLTSIVLPAGVTSINVGMFYGCSSLSSVVIPESVTSIGSDAFSGCSGLSSIVIPAGVTSISDYAFSGCSGLSSIVIPAGVTEISDSAFSGCSGLSSIVIPAGVTSIGDSAFSGCSSLSSVVIPAGVTSIGSYAFSGCSGLSSIVIPEGVTSIKWGTFSGCSGLTSITLPDSLEDMQGDAFGGCTSLRSISIPASVRNIVNDYEFFSSCISLESIDVDGGNETYASVDGVLFTKDLSRLISYPRGKSAKHVDIPEGVTYINPFAFSERVDLESVSFPESLEGIGHKAFAGCISLKTLTFPEGLKFIDSYTFQGAGLESVTIPAAVESIGWGAFSGCERLSAISVHEDNGNYVSVDGVLFTKDMSSLLLYPAGKTDLSYSIPEGVEDIDSVAFAGCTALRDLTLPSTLHYLESGTFANMAALTTVTIAEGLVSISEFCFENCASLTSVVLPNGLEEIGYKAFAGCTSLPDITIPSTVRYIEGSAFIRCASLASVDLPEGLEEIGSHAFARCTSLASVTIPSSVTYLGDGIFRGCTALVSATVLSHCEEGRDVGDGMFYGCTSLTNVVLDENVEEIGAKAFYGCTSLTSITLPSSLREIERKAFTMCDNLRELVFNGALPEFEDDAYYDADGYYDEDEEEYDDDDDDDDDDDEYFPTPITFKVYPYRGWENYVPPQGVTVVFMDYDIRNDFEYEIVGEEAVITKYISEQANVYIPAEIDEKPVTAIGDYAFADSSCVRSIHFPEGLVTIGKSAFEQCPNLEDAELPSSIAVIGDRAFAESGVYIPAVLPEYSSVGGIAIGKEAFEHCGTDNWFYISSSVKSIGDRAFARCFGMENVFISPSVTEIGDGPFDMCVYLENINVEDDNMNYVSVDGVLFTKDMKRLVQYPVGRHGSSYEIPAGVIVIGAYAFAYCDNFSVTIPEGVTEIGEKAFMICSLDSIEIPATVTTIGDGALWPIGTITVAEGNESFVMQDGMLFTKDMKRLVQCPTGKRDECVIPDSVTVIAPYAFACTGGVSFTGNLMENVTIPEGVTEIGDHAFYMSGLETLDIPSTVTVIGELAFSLCGELTSINVAESNMHYVSKDGVLFTKDMKCLIHYPAAKDGKSYDIPDEVEQISQEAFASNGSLESIAIPATVASIGDKAFSNCSALSEIIFYGTVPSFGDIEYQEAVVFSVPANMGWENWNAPQGVTVVVRESSIQTLELSAGWNWVSFQTLPGSHRINDVLGTDGFTANDIIQTSDGSARFNGTAWVPTNFTIEYGTLYQIYTAAPVDLAIFGENRAVSSGEVSAGWNWISNPLDEPIAPSELEHSGGWTQGDRIQGSDGFVTYSGRGWIPSSGFMLEPGKGYQIFTANEGTVSFGATVDDGTSLYAVVDLSGGPDAEAYPVRYTNSAPDVSRNTCRTTQLWLRRIPAGTFIMGSPKDENGRWNDDETQHEVTLTQDYFIGVFECTQKQWKLVMGDNPSANGNDTRPVESMSYDDIRGVTDGAGWPEHGHEVDAASFMGRLQAKTGLVFDLPTEAQWEYACRAGTTTALNSGKNLTVVDGEDPAMNEVGRYGYNQSDGKGGYIWAHTKVGSYLPNAWGLYDMHGNVLEWCLDWYGDYGTAAVSDPGGPTSGEARVLRGGYWSYNAIFCRSAFRSFDYPSNYGIGAIGFRVACLPLVR